MDGDGGFLDPLQTSAVFLDGNPRACHLARASLAAQLGDQFIELADAGRAERMAF